MDFFLMVMDVETFTHVFRCLSILMDINKKPVRNIPHRLLYN